MKFNMKRACRDCPFRKSKRFPLRRGRMLEIVDGVKRGDVFPCHRTTGRPYPRWRACAGWLFYQRRNKRDNAQMQVMERAGLYFPRKLKGGPDMITTRKEIEEAPWFKD